MRLNTKAGRTTITALSVISALLLVGGSLLFSKAKAQTPDNTAYCYGPIHIGPRPIGTAGISQDNLLIGLLFPPQRTAPTMPYMLQVITADLYISIPIKGSPTGRMPAFYSVFTVNTANGMQLVVVNDGTMASQSFATKSSDVTVRLLPAVQNNAQVQPLSLAVTHNFMATITNADGSTSSMPVQQDVDGLLLPAV